MSSDTTTSVPLWLLYDDEVDTWREAQGPFVRAWLAEQNFRGEKHRVLLLPDSHGGLGMAIGGLGKRQGGLSLWHGAGFTERLPPRNFHLAQTWDDAEATQLCLGFAYGAYRFERYRPNKPDRAASLAVPPNAESRFVAIAAESLKLARDLINTPANDLGPKELAAAAAQLAARHGASCREWVGEELLAAGFPAIHAVGRASASAPRLIDIQWSPAVAAAPSDAALGGVPPPVDAALKGVPPAIAPSDALRGEPPAVPPSRPGGEWPRVTLIGKGVCFDSGGLDVKPSSGMALMKKDMGGAAVALALMNMLMHAGIRAHLRLLVPAVENSIDGDAYRPGDVLSTRKGLTVEVGNTDAEGRLILCDALALADDEQPDLIVDFATLTGAARVALGPELPALFGSDERMVSDLARIAAIEHDPLWPMPLWAGYDDELGSKIADLNNVAASGFAGAIFGALFLKRFVTQTPHWLHIDLYAWNPKERPGRGVGAEAQAVRGVYRYLLQRYGVGN